MPGPLKEDELCELRYSVEMGLGGRGRKNVDGRKVKHFDLLLKKWEMKQVLDAEEQGEPRKLFRSFLFNITKLQLGV